jgi:predicted nucleic acid-binding protein
MQPLPTPLRLHRDTCVKSALTKAERQKLIQIGQARLLLADILALPPVTHPFEPLLGRAVEISSQCRSGPYDCLYVALAEREGCQKVTDDQKLIANLTPQFPFILPLAPLP